MKAFTDLINTVRILRSPQGCPWDRAQGVHDMKKYLLEETYELIDAIEKKKTKEVQEELGDIFLILVVIAFMFEENGKFNLDKVLSCINHKLIVRHPHVFAGKALKTKEEVLSHWIKNKAKHKKRTSIKERLPRGAPSLLLASIFFKELAAVSDKNFWAPEAAKYFKDLNDKCRLLGKKNDKEKAFTDILVDVCRLASFFHIDLEGRLRAAILKEAQKVFYSGRRK